MRIFPLVRRGRHTASHPPSHDVTFRPRTVTSSRHVTPPKGCDGGDLWRAGPGIIDFANGVPSDRPTDRAISMGNIKTYVTSIVSISTPLCSIPLAGWGMRHPRRRIHLGRSLRSPDKALSETDRYGSSGRCVCLTVKI